MDLKSLGYLDKLIAKALLGLGLTLGVTALIAAGVIIFYLQPRGLWAAMPALAFMPATATFTPSPTNTATPTPTASSTPTFTSTPLPTATSTPTCTPLPINTPTPTHTLLPTFTSTPTPTTPPTPDHVQRTSSVPILMYHYISDPPAGADRYRLDLSVTPANFEAQLAWLVQNGYHTVTLYDLYNYLAAGYPLPDKPIILTFDDGYQDAHDIAMPLLQKHGCVGVFFVLTGPADRDGAGGYLTWKQIAAMSAAGMDIELHSREHYDLRNRSNEFLVYQIWGGKQSIEAHTQKPVHWIAYPSGRYDSSVILVLKSADFWGALTTQSGHIHTTSTLFELPRIRIRGTDNLASFIDKITDLH